MDSRRNLDELREAMEIFEHESEFLHRYDNPVESTRFFMSLTNRDKKRLLYWALREGNTNIYSMANHLMRLLSPPPKNLEELSQQLQKDDIYEIEEIHSQLHDNSLFQTTKVPTEAEKERIIQVLAEASKRIGFLLREEALWVLLPYDIRDAPRWIECRNKNNSEKSAFHVFYRPSREEKVKLLTLFRESLWIIHLHNHPLLPKESEGIYFSLADKNFAKYWESLRPELASKMLWGVVQGNWIYGMPFDLPSHMIPLYSEKQHSMGVVTGCSSVFDRCDEAPKEQVIDAHAHWDSLSKKQKKKIRKYIRDIKRRNEGYNTH